jgi:uncharacterized protein YyaL (SSP411 family)
VFALLGQIGANQPHAVPHLLRAIDFHLSPVQEVALIAPTESDGLGELGEVVRSRFRPHVVLAGGAEGSERPELLAGRSAVEGRPAAYVCENFTCQMPVTDADELAAALSG